jgi:peptide chain release factor 2
MEAPDFWDDPAASAPILRERRSIERKLETLQGLRDDADELDAWRELLEEGETDDESREFFSRLERHLEQLELQLVLSHPEDEKSALVAIHPGAGGTESQDWADMLLRMYLRWGDQQGYKTEILERLDGEEAGIKSVTF